MRVLSNQDSGAQKTLHWTMAVLIVLTISGIANLIERKLAVSR